MLVCLSTYLSIYIWTMTPFSIPYAMQPNQYAYVYICKHICISIYTYHFVSCLSALFILSICARPSCLSLSQHCISHLSPIFIVSVSARPRCLSIYPSILFVVIIISCSSSLSHVQCAAIVALDSAFCSSPVENGASCVGIIVSVFSSDMSSALSLTLV